MRPTTSVGEALRLLELCRRALGCHVVLDDCNIQRLISGPTVTQPLREYQACLERIAKQLSMGARVHLPRVNHQAGTATYVSGSGDTVLVANQHGLRMHRRSPLNVASPPLSVVAVLTCYLANESPYGAAPPVDPSASGFTLLCQMVGTPEAIRLRASYHPDLFAWVDELRPHSANLAPVLV